MVISVLERRAEVGLRGALGATRRNIAIQFLVESVFLSGLGGIGRIALGTSVAVAYASSRGRSTVVPPAAFGAGLFVALAAGAAAGLCPAPRAARLSPTEALRTA